MQEPDNSLGYSPSHFWDALPAPLGGVRAIAVGFGLVSLVTIVCTGVATWLPAHGVAMLYVLAVVGGAVAFGMPSGLAAATCSFLAYNFYFLDPRFTFSIANPRDLIALVLFFAVAMTTGSLAGRMREVADEARARARSLQSLNELAIRLSGASNLVGVGESLASEAAQVAEGDTVVLCKRGDNWVTVARSPAAPQLTSADWQAAQRSATSQCVIYPAVPGWPGSVYEFHPMIAQGATLAVLGVHTRVAPDTGTEVTLQAMVRHAAIAMARISLETEKVAIAKEAEAERLRSALLSSVSHDIKTPLASIEGAVTSLRQLGDKMPDETKDDLLLAIEEEAKRLSRFVTNLLDMSRIEAGTPDLLEDWIDLEDATSASVRRARQLMPRANFQFESECAPAIIRANETLLEHVILNIIENAAKFSQPGTPINVVLRRSDDGYVLTVEDRGTGIDGAELPKIFDKFFRGAGSKAGGSGLGLSICKQIMEGLGGQISAVSPITAEGGTRVTLVFPVSIEAAATIGRVA
ncbi:MAG: DUF4118 domain-containing protein [Proteobacteria bacterium]|nr:DUF4118 domain-containing protein [Pseudomonadota bacterium]